MCTTWNQDQWLASTQKGTYENSYAEYTLVGESFHADGSRALTMADSYGNLTNVYDQKGHDTESYSWRTSRVANGLRRPTPTEQLPLATEDLAKRGFYPKPVVEITPEPTAVEAVLV